MRSAPRGLVGSCQEGSSVFPARAKREELVVPRSLPPAATGEVARALSLASFWCCKKKKKKSIAICFRTSVSCLSFLVYTKDIYQVSSKFHLFCFSFTTGFVGPSERQGTLQWLLVFIKEFMQSVSSRLTCLILPKNPADS